MFRPNNRIYDKNSSCWGNISVVRPIKTCVPWCTYELNSWQNLPFGFKGEKKGTRESRHGDAIPRQTFCIISQQAMSYFIMQIKICAEYRDLLPRPRLVCQETGLRSIGRSSDVPDKSRRGLGSMSMYSAQIFICFIACIKFSHFRSHPGTCMLQQ